MFESAVSLRAVAHRQLLAAVAAAAQVQQLLLLLLLLVLMVQLMMVHLMLLQLAALEQQRVTGGGADCRPSDASRRQHLGLQGVAAGQASLCRAACLLQGSDLCGGTCEDKRNERVERNGKWQRLEIKLFERKNPN